MEVHQMRKYTIQVVYAPNLWLSIIWGPGTGSDNKWGSTNVKDQVVINSQTAEIAIFDPKETDFQKWDTDKYTEGSSYGVLTYVAVMDVIAIAARIAHIQGEYAFENKAKALKIYFTRELASALRSCIDN